MKSNTTIGVLAVLVVLLLVAATAPEKTFSVLTSPQRWIDNYEMQLEKEASLASWAQVVKDAEAGDAEAMYKLGRKKQFWSNEEWTGIKRDAVEAERLIRAAADKNNIDAMMWVWAVDEAPVEYLNGLTEVIINKKDLNSEGIAKIGAFLFAYGTGKCDSSALNVSAEVLDAFEDSDLDMTAFRARHAEMERVFSSGHCSEVN